MYEHCIFPDAGRVAPIRGCVLCLSFVFAFCAWARSKVYVLPDTTITQYGLHGELTKENNYSPSVFVQLSLHHAFGVESWGLSDFVSSKYKFGEVLLRMLLPISKRMAFDAGARYIFFIWLFIIREVGTQGLYLYLKCSLRHLLLLNEFI